VSGEGYDNARSVEAAGADNAASISSIEWPDGEHAAPADRGCCECAEADDETADGEVEPGAMRLERHRAGGEREVQLRA
jgi:hypothetical protein